jgi:hypothetical protein
MDKTIGTLKAENMEGLITQRSVYEESVKRITHINFSESGGTVPMRQR